MRRCILMSSAVHHWTMICEHQFPNAGYQIDRFRCHGLRALAFQQAALYKPADAPVERGFLEFVTPYAHELEQLIMRYELRVQDLKQQRNIMPRTERNRPLLETHSITPNIQEPDLCLLFRAYSLRWFFSISRFFLRSSASTSSSTAIRSRYP